MDNTCVIAKAASIWGDKPVLVHEERSLNYSQLEEQILKALSFLSEAGVKKGTRVSLIIEDDFEFIPILFSLLRLGALICPLSSKEKSAILTEKIEIIKPDILILGKDSLYSGFDNKLIASEVLKGSRSLISKDKYENPEEALVVFTSGSSGKPKAIFHRLDAFLIGASESNNRTGFGHNDKWLLSLSTSNVAGLSILFRVFDVGARLLIPEAFSIAGVLSSLNKNENSWVSLVPTMLKVIFSEDIKPPQIAGILLGGAPVDEADISIIKRNNLTAFNCYGMSETAANVLSTSLEDCPDNLHTVGTTLGSTKVELIEGEIVFSGPRVCRGWIDDTGTYIETNGKLFTGDRGEFIDGRLLVLGRKDRIIISGGENIDPSEIEKFTCSMPDIFNAVVVPIPDKKWGQRPVLFIASKLGSEIDTEEVRNKILSSLGKVKTPERVIALKEFPRTVIGKINYSELRDRL